MQYSCLCSSQPIMDVSFLFACLLATAGGLLTGAFALPMKFLNRWKWENVWLSFSLFGFVVVPAAIVGSAIPDLPALYGQVATARMALVVALGYLWGLGAVTYGLGMTRLGIGLGSAFVLGISTLVGTLLPIFMADDIALKWVPFVAGMAMLMAGIAACGLAGRGREIALAESAGGQKRQYVSGVVICVVAGAFSSLLNVGMVAGKPIQDVASRGSAAPWAAGNAVWPVVLFGGFLANATYCGYLLIRNRSLRLYASGGWREWLGTIAMGTAWIVGVLMYGAGAFFMGDLGPIIGWPVFLSLMVICSYLVGRLTGEWRRVPAPVVRRMNLGIATIVVSLFVIAYSR